MSIFPLKYPPGLLLKVAMMLIFTAAFDNIGVLAEDQSEMHLQALRLAKTKADSCFSNAPPVNYVLGFRFALRNTNAPSEVITNFVQQMVSVTHSVHTEQFEDAAVHDKVQRNLQATEGARYPGLVVDKASQEDTALDRMLIENKSFAINSFRNIQGLATSKDQYQKFNVGGDADFKPSPTNSLPQFQNHPPVSVPRLGIPVVVNFGTFPNAVALGTPTGWSCSGVIVSSNKILTAAHCVVGKNITRAFFGPDVDWKEAGWILAVRSNLIVYPDFHFSSDNLPRNDLAILTLANPISFQPFTFANSNQLGSATYILGVGYGSTNVEDASAQSYGRRTVVKLTVNELYCAKISGGFDPADTLCAVELDRNQNPLRIGQCGGDSGGPAYVYDEKSRAYSLVGITSYRYTLHSDAHGNPVECGAGGTYTLILPHLDWIRSNL